MPDSGDFDSPFHDTEVMALEDAIRDHPAKGFRLPRYTASCPVCGRGMNRKFLEAPWYNPDAAPACPTCNEQNKKWFRTPEQIEASRKRREQQAAEGFTPHGSAG